jgi:excisionase family DNA binding protein
VTERPEGSPKVPKRLAYSVEEAADLIGIGRTFMFYLVGTGEVDSFKIGKLRKISHEALVEYLKRLSAEQAAAARRQKSARQPDSPDDKQQ